MNSDNNNFRDKYYDDEEFDGTKDNGNDDSSYGNGYLKSDTDTLNNHGYADIQKYEQYAREHSEGRTPYKKPKKKSVRKFLLRLVAVVLAVILVFFAVSWVMSLFLPQKTNFLIMATDKDGTRTDTLMLGTFDKGTKDITLISIPRDTYVTVSDENYSKMKEEYPQPGSPSMKINAVHHYGGSKYGVSMVKNEVERLTGLNIDYYIKVDFDAFRYVIDSIGGIEFYVPQNMKYSDPYQNLYIDLKEGNQRLNGEQAEHLLRYRSGYANADLGRVKVQQDFMKAFIAQTLSKRTIVSNLGVYYNVIFKYDYVKTDAGVLDAASYAMLLGGVNAEKVKTHTLPGSAQMAGGQSVYKPDDAEMENLFSQIYGD